MVRTYGSAGPTVVLIHGGPGAAGSMAPISRQLADSFRVLEPFQSTHSTTVAEHVADLDEVLRTRCADSRPSLVGHSWGAMLALAYAAAHRHRVRTLVLIGCGTFDLEARRRLNAIVESRIDESLRRRFERLVQEFPDPNDRFGETGKLLARVYNYDPLPEEPGMDITDYVADTRSNEATWNDMVRLQEAGHYPASFRTIHSPVLMLHGADDPHPGQMIHASLKPFLPAIDYREWQRCGHYPWMERAVRDEFFAVLRDWLTRHAA